MDFVAVPAGTTPDQALKIRGSDHDLELATADPFITVLGNATQARSAPGGRSIGVLLDGIGRHVGPLLYEGPTRSKCRPPRSWHRPREAPRPMAAPSGKRFKQCTRFGAQKYYDTAR